MNSRVWWKRNRRTDPPLWDIHSGELAAECSAWKQFLLFIFIEKDMTMKTQNFSGNTDCKYVFMFSRNFYKRCSSVMLSRSEHRAAKSLGHPSWAGSTACVPRGGCGQPITLIAPGALVPHPGGHPLPMSMSQVQSTHRHVGYSWCASLLSGVRTQGRVWTWLLLVGRGGRIAASVGLSQTWWDCISTHSDPCLASHGAPPCTLTCWFHGVDSHCFIVSWGFPSVALAHLPILWGSEFTEFSMTFFLSALCPRLLVLMFNLPFDNRGVSCQHKNNKLRQIVSWLTSLEKVFRSLIAAWICIQTEQQVDSKSCCSV